MPQICLARDRPGSSLPFPIRGAHQNGMLRVRGVSIDPSYIQTQAGCIPQHFFYQILSFPISWSGFHVRQGVDRMLTRMVRTNEVRACT